MEFIWKLNNVTLGGWMFSVKGDNRVSILYPSHGLFNEIF